ncbi:MAG: molybdopterin adenylyltransferase [Dehalococcoidia bacterium]|jgi:molybdenum cofactor synthesis domain-containing protein|nr:molybdopterin adenylyltransferase [Dehalococcoidia bacterium]
MVTAGILTISDKGSRGEREDESGKAIKKLLALLGARLVKYDIVPDEREIISQKLIQWADEEDIDLIITTGGTGLSPRDVTPEATLAVLERMVPGLAETMRAESLKKTPMAMLSRGVAGIRRGSLIINLPGSPKAVQECLEVVLPALPHAMEVLKGEAVECGRELEEG